MLSALTSAGPLKRIRSDTQLMNQMGASYRAATAKLRARLLEISLADTDSRTLATLLARREETQAVP
jgi:hypothetical protein